MTFQQIKYLLEIYRTGSIATAAKNLYLVPSSLSIAIGNLEQELDCQIFTRSKSGMIPTPRGMEIIEYANKIYANYQLMTAPPMAEQRRITIAGKIHQRHRDPDIHRYYQYPANSAQLAENRPLPKFCRHPYPHRQRTTQSTGFAPA